MAVIKNRHIDASLGLGKKLFKLREDNKMTQKQVAKAIGKSASFVSQVESGHKGMLLSTLMKFARLFEIDPAFLLAQKELTERELRRGIKYAELSEQAPDHSYWESIEALLDKALEEIKK